MDTGQIEFICACMFSGKTTALIECIDALPQSQQVMCMKTCIDDRYSQSDIVSHDGKRLHATALPTVGDMLNAAEDAEVVAIDEIHFLDDALVDVCRTLAGRGKRIICCGLDRDMWGDPFLHVQQLSNIAETTVLTGTCAQCSAPANRTHRKVPLTDNNLVGGTDAFEPRCEACFEPPDAPKPQALPGLA